MSKKSLFGILSVSAVLMLAGCATGRNYDADINALNSKLSMMQGQLTSKDEEIARLQGQMKEEESSRMQAEAERRALNDRLNATLEELSQAKARAAKAPKKEVIPDSDLK